MHTLTIRPGKPEDIPQVFELIKELAIYEKALDQVETSVEQLTEDAFGEEPLYGLIVAEADHVLVGISIFYYRYSTWKGKRLYLEDILVTESFRGKGIGTKLFEATARHAHKHKCSGMNWLVLDWNEPAINFYKKFNAAIDPEWRLVGINAQQLETFVK
ncbi:MAG TPA: GNAT family N-acetyltransferase [Cytophagaceae bacterium]|nr:GNAT family N-acetyltransferase [Cytophagaceae bacterium]